MLAVLSFALMTVTIASSHRGLLSSLPHSLATGHGLREVLFDTLDTDNYFTDGDRMKVALKDADVFVYHVDPQGYYRGYYRYVHASKNVVYYNNAGQQQPFPGDRYPPIKFASYPQIQPTPVAQAVPVPLVNLGGLAVAMQRLEPVQQNPATVTRLYPLLQPQQAAVKQADSAYPGSMPGLPFIDVGIAPADQNFMVEAKRRIHEIKYQLSAPAIKSEIDNIWRDATCWRLGLSQDKKREIKSQMDEYFSTRIPHADNKRVVLKWVEDLPMHWRNYD